MGEALSLFGLGEPALAAPGKATAKATGKPRRAAKRATAPTVAPAVAGAGRLTLADLQREAQEASAASRGAESFGSAGVTEREPSPAPPPGPNDEPGKQGKSGKPARAPWLCRHCDERQVRGALCAAHAAMAEEYGLGGLDAQTVYEPGAEPWRDSEETAARIAATLAAAGLKRVASEKYGTSWVLDVDRLDGVRVRRAPAYEAVPEATRWRIRSLQPAGMVRVSEIQDKTVRARIEASDKAGAANGSHATLGPILGKEVDAAFREMVAEALARDAAVRACEAIAAETRRAVVAAAWGRYGIELVEEETSDADRGHDERGGADLTAENVAVASWTGADDEAPEAGVPPEVEAARVALLGALETRLAALGAEGADLAEEARHAAEEDAGAALDAAGERLAAMVLRGLSSVEDPGWQDKRAGWRAFYAGLPSRGAPDPWGSRPAPKAGKGDAWESEDAREYVAARVERIKRAKGREAA